MKFLGEDQFLDAESAEDTETATELLNQQLDDAYQRLNALPAESGDIERAELQLKIGAILVDLERGEEAFDIARQAFDTFAQHQSWDGAVQACDVMFQADQDDSLAALARPCSHTAGGPGTRGLVGGDFSHQSGTHGKYAKSYC